MPSPGAGLDPVRATAEGLAGVAVCAVHADGVVDLAEDAHLAHQLRQMHLFQALLPGELDEILAALHDAVAQVPYDILLEACAREIPIGLKPTAFFLAVDTVMADGEVTRAEAAFLETAQGALEIDDETARVVTEALEIKHRA